MTLVLLAVAVWVGAWALNGWLTRGGRDRSRAVRAAVPLVFGATVLIVWELVVRGLDVPPAILPAPSRIARTFAASTGLLWGDFVQTILKGALSGLALGVAAALAVAVLVERFDFLRRGLLPGGDFVGALRRVASP